jgi:hypothetical protein
MGAFCVGLKFMALFTAWQIVSDRINIGERDRAISASSLSYVDAN